MSVPSQLEILAAWLALPAAERGGRRSWSPPARIIARRPYLRGERLSQVREP